MPLQPGEEKSISSPDAPDPSLLTLAFASLILLNKPPELTATEFIYYLRGCTQKNPASGTSHHHHHHLSTDAYWRNVCEDKDIKILELDQKLSDANAENKRLAGQLDSLKRKRDDSDANEPKAKKPKAGARKADPIPVDDLLAKWEPIKKNFEDVSPGKDNLFIVLRSLHYAKDAHNISLCLVKLCKVLASRIRSLCTCDGQEDVCIPPVQPPKETRNKKNHVTSKPGTKASKQRLPDSAWVGNVTRAIDDAFRRLFMAIARLSSTTEKPDATAKDHSSATAAASAICDLTCSILDSVYLSSYTHIMQNPAAATTTPRPVHTRDIRTGVITTLQSFLCTLAVSPSDLQANVLEGAFYTILEAAGKCLCIPASPESGDREEHANKRMALQETSKYILELLKVTVPLYQSHLASRPRAVDHTAAHHLPDLAKQRFHDAVMKGLFGELKAPEWEDLRARARGGTKTGTKRKGDDWGGIELQDEFILVDEEGFANEVWKLLDLEDFALVW
ncbi:hypothetical protein DRE_02268 [Drechslerella stenobrocha 248]|uniref:Uncharacterized protein n=1 Tax=Drechslerella stenobrocha 248 TaxID=1043628 RepID=W7HXC8_9PEZI|nr:hypothetical protein DRE_02268 [Drechslerella stenobrocha 248]